MTRHSRLTCAAYGVRRRAGPSACGIGRLHHRHPRRRAAGAAGAGLHAGRGLRRSGARLSTRRRISICSSGRSTIVNVGSTIARVSLTVPDIADAMVTAPGQLLIHGKQPGTISLFVWDRGGAIKTYEVKVRRDLTRPGRPDASALPGRADQVRGSGKDVVLSGTVSSNYVHREGRGRRWRLRREEGERRQPAEAAGGRRLEPGHAESALRRGQPQRAAGARGVLRRERLQERLVRPHRRPGSFPRPSGIRTGPSSSSATS